MFNRHHRKARLLFALSDVILLALAFEIAYQIRATLHIEHIFYLTAEVKALLLGGSIVAYLLIGDWLGHNGLRTAGPSFGSLAQAYPVCTYATNCSDSAIC